jgi:hypothetical protein
LIKNHFISHSAPIIMTKKPTRQWQQKKEEEKMVKIMNAKNHN